MSDARTRPIITRCPGNPILSSVPYAGGLVYNGSVLKYQGRYVMLVRVDHADLAAQKLENITDVALAFSDDGIAWHVQPQPVIAWRDAEVVAPTDVRLMLVEGRVYATVAVNTKHGMETWCVTTEDFQHYDPVFKMVPDNRDVVIFPHKLGDKYLRIERPFPTFGHGKKPVFDMWTSDSPDLTYWGNPQVLLDVDHVPYATGRIGAGTPPLRSDRGWLLLIHAVTDDPNGGKNGWEDKWTERYAVGALLLDAEDPRRVIGLSPEPVMVPEAPYEVSGGYRNNVLFPCGWVLEESGEVKIYYGAADTVQCLATAHLDDLLAACRPLEAAH